MLLFGIVAGIVAGMLGCASLGAHVALAKGRSPVEGAGFGFVLGPLGVLVEVLLPTIERAPKLVTLYRGELPCEAGNPCGPLREARPLRRTESSD